jgi:desulfoferrodoxin (superoxide reductase-like protein)
MKSKMILSLFFLFSLLLKPALANKASVSIEAPKVIKANEEATITINITHKGNSRFHYVNRVVVTANGQEVARWDFSSGNRPEGENFSREIKLQIQTDTEIVAEANCNLHGSAGPARVTIKIESEKS